MEISDWRLDTICRYQVQYRGEGIHCCCCCARPTRGDDVPEAESGAVASVAKHLRQMDKDKEINREIYILRMTE